MKASETEQVKARASFLNSVGAGAIVASVITPAVGLSIGALLPANWNMIVIVTAGMFWAVIGIILHLLALRALDRLE